jgi:hypothetical protein
MGPRTGIDRMIDGYMYFRGTDDTFWRSKTDGTQGSNPAGYKTQSNLFVASDAAYFRGTDNALWKYDFRDGTLIDFAIAAVDQLQGWYNRDTGLWNGDSKPNRSQAASRHIGKTNYAAWGIC